MDYERLKSTLIKHEGIRYKPYRCTANHLTIGVGRNLDDCGISHSEAMLLLDNDIALAIGICSILFKNFKQLDDVRQEVLINMAFNLGQSRLGMFRKLIAAVEACDFEEAAIQMERSAWYKQVGNRAKQLVCMMRTGEYAN